MTSPRYVLRTGSSHRKFLMLLEAWVRITATSMVALAIATGASGQVNWLSVGGDPGATRYSRLDQINRGNVAELEVAWTLHTGGLSCGKPPAIQCTPIVVDGTMYLTSPDTQVIAVNAATGVEKWR